MKCENVDGIWMAVIRKNGRVFLGFSPKLGEAMDYANELLQEATDAKS